MVYNKIYAQLGEERHITLDPVNYQYDIKQILVIQGETVPDYYEADVCNVGDTATLTMVGTAADGVEIPDKFLLDGRNVLVYIVIPGSGGDVQTRYDITIPVDERAEREDIDPSEAEQQQIDSLINALNSGVGRAETAATAAEESATDAEGSAGEAEDQAENAEAWAVGQRAGEDVPDTDPTYHNNSKYYAGMAEAAAEEAGQHEASWETWVQRAESAADDAEGSARAAAGAKADAEAAAQTATQKATEAGNSADAAAGSAASARQTVDGAIGAINTAKEGALTAIGSAGSNAVGAVEQAGTTQTGRVTSEGNTQVNRVQAKGDEVLDSIPQDYSDLVDDVADLNRQLSDVDNRLSTLDGLSGINIERGNISYGWNALTFSDSTTRMRTPEDGGVQVTTGDKLTMDTWTGNTLFPIIYGADNHYHQYDDWYETDFVIPQDGVLYFIVRKNPERVLTDSDVFNVLLKKPDKFEELQNELDVLDNTVSSINKNVSELKIGKKENVCPVLVAHAALEGLYPENTVLGVLGAKKYGYKIVEADLRITSDGHFVMCHDDTVDRTTDGTGKISEMTLAQVKACNIDVWGSYVYDSWTWSNLKIPTLEEYLTACIDCDIVPMIEARDFTEAQLDNLIDIIRQFGLEDTIIVESFTKATINYLRSVSRVRLGALLSTTTDDVDYCASIGNCILAINATSTNPSSAFMEYANNKGVRIAAWTVNTQNRIKELALLGISQIITNIAIDGNDFSEAFPVFYKSIEDVNSDSPDNWGFRYYVGNMLRDWNIDVTLLKAIVSFEAEIYYDTNKPELLLCSDNIPLEDKVGDWQTVKQDSLVRITSSLQASAQFYIKLAESGNVRMKNATVKFYSV